MRQLLIELYTDGVKHELYVYRAMMSGQVLRYYTYDESGNEVITTVEEFYKNFGNSCVDC